MKNERVSTVRRRRDLALNALEQALSLRREMGVKPYAPAPVFDIIERTGIKLTAC